LKGHEAFKQPKTVGVKNGSFFPPIFTPGVAQKELVEDSGLKDTMTYLNNFGVDGKDAMETLYKRYPRSMIDQMVAAIRKHKPEVTDAEIAITIMQHI